MFEEVFTLGHHLPGTEAFLVELADLVENYVPVRFLEKMQSENTRLDFPYEKQRYKIVVALRDDFVHRLDGLRSTMPSIMRNRYRLKRLSHDHAMEAVLGPGKTIVDDGVARAIVDWVAAADMNEAGPEAPRQSTGEIEVEPAILSLVCRELNRRRSAAGHDRIELEDLRESQTDILTDFYEDSFKDLDPRARVFVEDRLITGSGFRTAVPLEDAREIGDAIEALMQRRLIRSEERLGIPHIELSHDRLTDLVLASRRDREDRRHREEEISKEHELQEEEDRKRTALHKAREARSSRILNRVLAGVVAILLVAGGIILYQMGQVNFQMEQVSIAADIAKAWELSLQATASLEDDPELSILLGLHSAALTRNLEVGVLPVTVEILNRALATSREVANFQLGSRTMSGVVFGNEGQTVATVDAAGVTTWDLETGNELGFQRGEEGAIVALSGDGTRFSLATESTVSVHDIETGDEELVLQDLPGSVRSLALSEDGARLAVVIGFREDMQADIGVWEVGGARIFEGKTPNDVFNEFSDASVVFSADGRRIAATYYDMLATQAEGYGVAVWEIGTAEPLSDFKTRDPIASIALNFDGRLLAATRDTTERDSTGSASLWDVDNGKPLLVDLNNFPAGNVVAFGRDATRHHLAMARTGGSFTVWNLETETEVFTFAGHSGSVLGITFDPGGRRLATVGNDGTGRIWSLDNIWLPVVGDRLTPVWAVAFSPDGNRLATSYQDGAFQVEPETPNGPAADDVEVWSVAYNPDGDLAAAGAGIELFNGILRVWLDGDSGLAPMEFEGPFGFLAVAYSPNGERLATSSFDEKVRVWYSDKREAEPLSTPEYGVCEGLTFDPAGERLAASCRNATVAVWSLDHLESDGAMLTLQHDDAVNSVAFSDDGERLATAGNDGIVTMWNSRTGDKLFVMTGHDAGVSGIAFRPAAAPDEPTWLATSSFDGTVRIWDVSESEDAPSDVDDEIMIFEGGPAVNHLTFTVDGKQLAAAWADGTVRRYLLDTDELINLAWSAIARHPKSLTDQECWRYFQKKTCEPPHAQREFPEDR